jgi:type IV pilus assembly protein PilC
MARFYYKAVNRDGRVVDGYIEATNESDLELRISNMEMDLIRYKADKAPRFLQRGKVDTKELISFTYHLEQLLNAGVPLVDALQDLRDSVSQGALKDVASGLIENI